MSIEAICNKLALTKQGKHMKLKSLIFTIIVLTLTMNLTFAMAETPIERIDKCKNEEINKFIPPKKTFQSPQCNVRARAGSQELGGCKRQEERGACSYTADSGWVIDEAHFIQGRRWENATMESVSHTTNTATVNVKVNGHGCDRQGVDVEANFFVAGTAHREINAEDMNDIWKRCVEKELKK
jgi:hypothetical protein